MKIFKVILELIFYIAIVVSLVISIKLLLNDKSSVIYCILVISLAIMVIHQLKDDLTLWFGNSQKKQKYNRY